MKLRNRTRRKPFLPISSMSDIAFLLLIFIMLLSLINYKRVIKIDYPESKYQEVTQTDNNLEIWIDKNGNIFNDGNNVDLITLEGIIVDAIAKKPSTRVHIISDKNTKYKDVDKVINILKLLQHRVVSLVVKDNEK
jgi:biopolymer transport protein ExbD